MSAATPTANAALAQAVERALDELEATVSSARMALAAHGATHAAEDLQDSTEDIEAVFANLREKLRLVKARDRKGIEQGGDGG